MKGIEACIECAHYDAIADKCARGAQIGGNWAYPFFDDCPLQEAAPVVHGQWILETHKDALCDRWSVTAKCSECCDEKKEIWEGLFPGIPEYIAGAISLQCASNVVLDDFCPRCGAKMDGKEDLNAE